MSVEPKKPGAVQVPKLKYYGAKSYGNLQINNGMAVPADNRLLRDIKLHEFPSWFAKRNFSPLGLFFTLKRFQHGVFSKYIHVRRTPGVFLAQLVTVCAIGMYCDDYFNGLLKLEMHRKYH